MTPPPLAQYKARSEYVPKYGDYIVWSKWFSTWHGFVVNYDKSSDEVHAVFAGVPFLLLTMEESDHETETVKIKLSKLRSAPNGKFAIQTMEGQTPVWFI